MTEASLEPTDHPCPNCDRRATGAYCSACGQSLKPPRQNLRTLLEDLVTSLSNLDSKILRSLLLVMTKPGVLTRRFFENRSVRYVTPVKFFFVGVFAYSLFFALAPVEFVQIQFGTARELGFPVGGGRWNSLTDFIYFSRDVDRVVLPELEALIRQDPVGVATRLDRADEISGLFSTITAYAPLLWLLPGVATSLLFYRRRRRAAIEHLVLATEQVSAQFVLIVAAACLSWALLAAGLRLPDEETTRDVGDVFLYLPLSLFAGYVILSDRAFFRAPWWLAAVRAGCGAFLLYHLYYYALVATTWLSLTAA